MSLSKVFLWSSPLLFGIAAWMYINPGKTLTEEETRELMKKYHIPPAEYQRRKKENEILMQQIKKAADVAENADSDSDK